MKALSLSLHWPDFPGEDFYPVGEDMPMSLEKQDTHHFQDQNPHSMFFRLIFSESTALAGLLLCVDDIVEFCKKHLSLPQYFSQSTVMIHILIMESLFRPYLFAAVMLFLC